MSMIFFLMSVSSMSHVDFEKWLSCPFEFKGQGPQRTVRVDTCFLSPTPHDVTISGTSDLGISYTNTNSQKV